MFLLQCYDQYLLKSLRRAAETRGHSFWARGPDNSGSYNSQPKETGFFCDGGDYNGHYGRFFLGWYSQVLIDHGDRLMALARMAFEGICIAAKVSELFDQVFLVPFIICKQKNPYLVVISCVYTSLFK